MEAKAAEREALAHARRLKQDALKSKVTLRLAVQDLPALTHHEHGASIQRCTALVAELEICPGVCLVRSAYMCQTSAPSLGHTGLLATEQRCCR